MRDSTARLSGTLIEVEAVLLAAARRAARGKRDRPSVDHAVLRGLLTGLFKEPELLVLLDWITFCCSGM